MRVASRQDASAVVDSGKQFVDPDAWVHLVVTTTADGWLSVYVDGVLELGRQVQVTLLQSLTMGGEAARDFGGCRTSS